MKKLSSVLALAALLGFGSSVFAEETPAPANGDQKAPATTTAPASDDKSSAEAPAAATAPATKDDSSED